MEIYQKYFLLISWYSRFKLSVIEKNVLTYIVPQ